MKFAGPIIYGCARPTHSDLNLSPGLDFEARIVAKVNAAQRLREALVSKHCSPGQLNMGSITDAYPPVERRLRITRSALEVLAQARHPYSIMCGGKNDAAFGTRMTGQGLWAQLLRQRFIKACSHLGLDRERLALDLTQFSAAGLAPTQAAAQGKLF